MISALIGKKDKKRRAYTNNRDANFAVIGFTVRVSIWILMKPTTLIPGCVTNVPRNTVVMMIKQVCALFRLCYVCLARNSDPLVYTMIR